MGVNFIEFPNLGIRLNISPIAFSIGNITVHWYGIIIAAAIMIALALASKQSKKFDINEDDFLDMFLIALPVSIIFARLFFVVFTWDSYKNNLLGIFRIWEGGLAIYGAIIGAVLSVFIYSRWKKIDMLYLMDFACVYLPLAQAIGRWGNFTNQELYGSNTDLPWGMTGNIIQMFPSPGVDGTRLVHPTFLYESILNILVFLLLLRIRKNHKVKGSVFAAYLMLYSFVRFMMEFLRTDEFGVGAIRYNQVFAVAVFIGALIWLIYLNKRSLKQAQADEVIPPSPYAEVLQDMENEEEKSVEEKSVEEKSVEESETAIKPETGIKPETSEDSEVEEVVPETVSQENNPIEDDLPENKTPENASGT